MREHIHDDTSATHNYINMEQFLVTWKFINPSNELRYATMSEYIAGHLKFTWRRPILSEDIINAKKISLSSFLHENLFLDNIQCLFFHTVFRFVIGQACHSLIGLSGLKHLCKLRASSKQVLSTYIRVIVYHSRFKENLNQWCYFKVPFSHIL